MRHLYQERYSNPKPSSLQVADLPNYQAMTNRILHVESRMHSVANNRCRVSQDHQHRGDPQLTCDVPREPIFLPMLLEHVAVPRILWAHDGLPRQHLEWTGLKGPPTNDPFVLLIRRYSCR